MPGHGVSKRESQLRIGCKGRSEEGKVVGKKGLVMGGRLGLLKFCCRSQGANDDQLWIGGMSGGWYPRYRNLYRVMQGEAGGNSGSVRNRQRAMCGGQRMRRAV
jgi:hypothetical protein